MDGEVLKGESQLIFPYSVLLMPSNKSQFAREYGARRTKKGKKKKGERNNREEDNKVLTFHFLPCTFPPLERMLSEGK